MTTPAHWFCYIARTDDAPKTPELPGIELWKPTLIRSGPNWIFACNGLEQSSAELTILSVSIGSLPDQGGHIEVDLTTGTLSAIADPSGFSTIFYTSSTTFFGASSHPLSLLLQGWADLTPDPIYRMEERILGITSSKRSPFLCVKRLQSVESLHVTAGSRLVRVSNYRSEPQTAKERGPNADLEDKLTRLLEENLQPCIDSNPKAALALSGGVDSVLLAGISARLGLRDALTVYSLPSADSVKLCRTICRKLEIKHHGINVTPEWISEYLVRRCVFRAGYSPTITGGRLLWYAAKHGFASVIFGHNGDDSFLRGDKYSNPERYISGLTMRMNKLVGLEEIRSSEILSLLSERHLFGSDLAFIAHLSESDIARDPHEAGDELESQCLGIGISVPFLGLSISEMLMALSPAQRMLDSTAGYWQYQMLKATVDPYVAQNVIESQKEASFSVYGSIASATVEQLQKSFGKECRSIGRAWEILIESLFHPTSGRPGIQILAS